MLQRSWRAFGLTLWGLGLVTGGCKPLPCGPDGIEEGNVYEATVVAPYSVDGLYPGPEPVGHGSDVVGCGDLDAIASGTTVAIQMTGRGDKGDACRAAEGLLIEVPPAVTVIKSGAPMGTPGMIIGGLVSARVGGCEGWYYVEYYQSNRSTDIFAEPQLGEQPPVVMWREFRGIAGSCRTCGDYFVVRLKERTP